jgi:hypothetical protein
MLYVSRKSGFRGKWCSWIEQSISSAHFSILVNGSPNDFFSSSRGLGQGGPLSPLLFVFVMEALSKMISAVVVLPFMCYLKGFYFFNNNLRV